MLRRRFGHVGPLGRDAQARFGDQAAALASAQARKASVREARKRASAPARKRASAQARARLDFKAPKAARIALPVSAKKKSRDRWHLGRRPLDPPKSMLRSPFLGSARRCEKKVRFFQTFGGSNSNIDFGGVRGKQGRCTQCLSRDFFFALTGIGRCFS